MFNNNASFCCGRHAVKEIREPMSQARQPRKLLWQPQLQPLEGLPQQKHHVSEAYASQQYMLDVLQTILERSWCTVRA